MCFSPIASTDDLPLPHDVENLHQPYEVSMGVQPVQIQGFSTSLSEEQLRTFYGRALPKAGWKMGALPWLAQFQHQDETFRQTLREHPELANEPALKGYASQKDARVQQMIQHQLYANRGKERVLLNFSPQGARTLVFINRWQERDERAPFASAEHSDQAAPAQQPGWPTTNPCCTGESVPAALRKLPNSIPPYPNGRMVSTGAAPGQRPTQSAMSEMYLTDDSAQQVAEYYRSQMAYNGWSPVEVPSGSITSQLDQFLGAQDARFDMQALAFRNEHGICGIAVVESDASQTTQQGPTGRTLITVNYIESALLNRAAQK